ncbi:MAG: bifunctional (p)ppGpp synthetase/guanosine-3',5'-bis(diphosphate) 3'-pyrophosphohydrolase [Chloroflexi bacterium]|nr:bifunctional (p)ppGpp synthetase/guanosine-3',5'-bis(diphosphate) 3'-pyrophosphohydrolase [Chloroflexota bacterium]
MREYLPDVDLEIVKKAYDFAAAALRHRRLCSGEPYIQHPLATAIILAKMQLDPEAIAAGLLHDVPEDTVVELEEVEKEFGPRIARLVDGVTKLSKIRWATPDEQARREKEQQAENLRKMFLAMAEDVRVVLIKLADRLHNMRTLWGLERSKQIRIAEQTMEIYAPLANRLGIWWIKSELEDLAFEALDPEKYQQLSDMIAERQGGREKYLSRVIKALKRALSQAGIKAEISGRSKHVYSIYEKMQRKHRTLDEIYDVVAVRIIVDQLRDCYAALGVIHTLWHPIPGEFDDYIAMPKESMYQSLHTAVLALDARPLEIQIRTKEMHEVAEYGIAAHWRYKEGGGRDVDFDAKITWLRHLLEWRDSVADAQEFVDSLKSDVFRDQVYVFTPGGDVIDLPSGATPIDFAYRIHTDVGHQCVGAKVNDRLVSLDHQLHTGEVVKIITSRTKKGPSRDWLNPNFNYIRTANAREKVRQWFRHQERDENVAQGKESLEKELRRLGLDNVGYEQVAGYFHKYKSVDDLLAAIGYGAVTTQQIATRLVEAHTDEGAVDQRVLELPESTPGQSDASGITVMGVGDLLVNLAGCCKPVPGDDIIGYVTRGRGVTVHRVDCRNVNWDGERERLVRVDWGGAKKQGYPVSVRIDAWDRVGLLRDVTALVAEEGLNITSAQSISKSDRTVTLLITIEVGSLSELSRILARIEGIRDVLEVRRDLGRKAAS